MSILGLADTSERPGYKKPRNPVFSLRENHTYRGRRGHEGQWKLWLAGRLPHGVRMGPLLRLPGQRQGRNERWAVSSRFWVRYRSSLFDCDGDLRRGGSRFQNLAAELVVFGLKFLQQRNTERPEALRWGHSGSRMIGVRKGTTSLHEPSEQDRTRGDASLHTLSLASSAACLAAASSASAFAATAASAC